MSARPFSECSLSSFPDSGTEDFDVEEIRVSRKASCCPRRKPGWTPTGLAGTCSVSWPRALTRPSGQWRRLVGILTLMDSQVPLGRLHRRPIQLSFRDCWDWRRHSMTQLIPLLPNDRLVLSWWSHRSNVMVGQTLVPFTSDLHCCVAQGLGSPH